MLNVKSNHTIKFVILPIAVFIVLVAVVVVAYSSANSKNTAQPGQLPISSAAAVKSGQTAQKQVADKPANFEISNTTAKLMLKVDNLSCSGCIYTIKTALSGISGIQEILVDVAAGEASVYYDTKQLQDVNPIPEAITASGYPAKIVKIITADQLRQENERVADRAESYVASVGDFDISRSDYNIELNHAKSRYAQIYGANIFDSDRGEALLNNLKAQLVTHLIEEGIQLQEIQKAGFTVTNTYVDAEFREYLNKRNADFDQLKTDLKKNGYDIDYFMKKFETRVLIKTYIQEKVVEGAATDVETQQRYSSWFNNARLLAKVEYYDKDLERLVQSQASKGGCSGSSCSTAN